MKDKCSNPPAYFYKYQSLEGENFQHLKNLLHKREIFFQNPSKFNDPFECAPYIFIKDRGKHESKTKEYKEFISKNSRILCLSTKNDCHLMWAHYGNKHTGICLAFNGKSGFFERTHRVNYQENRPKINEEDLKNKEKLGACISRENEDKLRRCLENIQPKIWIKKATLSDEKYLIKI